MKKILIYLLGLTLFLASCKKKEDVPNDSTDERLSAKLAEIQKQLTGAEFGWRSYLLTGNTNTSGIFLFTFDTNNRTVMSSDIGITPVESSYRIKALQRPTLIFDTYNYLHLLSDPTPTKAGGVVGEGYTSDFQFAILSTSTADTVKLEGTYNKSRMNLVRIKTATEKANLISDVVNVANNLGKLKTYFKRSTIEGTDCEIRIDVPGKYLAFTYLNNGNPVTIGSLYYSYGNSVYFYDPIKIKDKTVTSLNNLTFNSGSNSIDGAVNGTAINIREAITPIYYDKTWSQQWYTQMSINFNGCWVSDQAFHVNGVDDYCNFKAVANYQNLWYAGASVFGGTSEGLIMFTGALGSPYMFSKVPFTVNTDGTAKFTLLSSTGTFTGTGAAAVAMTAARAIMYGGAVNNSSNQDWYFIQTTPDGLHYDMVRKTDALAWISWRPR